MFQKFLQNDICMDILFWLINHSTGDYDAAIIAYDCNITDIPLFTSIIYIMNELGIVNVDESSDALRIIFNEDSLIVQSFKNFKESFENEAYRNSNVCGAFITIDSGEFALQREEMNNLFDQLSEEERFLFYNMLNDYENYELSDDPDQAKVEKTLLNQLKDLDEKGQLDKFREYVKRNLYI